MWGTELRFIFAGVIVVGFWIGVFELFEDWRAAGRVWFVTAIVATIVYHLIPPWEGRKD
jgi:hypothetical protein